MIDVVYVVCVITVTLKCKFA